MLLFSKVTMWDGWLWASLLKQKNYGILYQLLDQAKLPHLYATYRLIDSLGNPIVLSNILVFASWLVAGICVYLILKDFTKLGEKNAFFAACLFLLSPIYMVRFELALVTYSITNAAFFLGAYAFLRAGAMTRVLSKIVWQILAAGFFISAFLTASFLVFYGAFMLFVFWQEKYSGTSKWRLDAVYAFVKKNIVWLLLPFVFYWAHQKFIGTPYGLYQGYNSFVLSAQGISIFKKLFILIDRAYQFVAYGFFYPILFSISILQNKIFLAMAIILAAGIFLLDKKFALFSSQDDSGQAAVTPKTLFIWGVVLFVFGSVAYILVGESPSPYGSGFDMRHGLILPLGCALIILAAIDGLLKNKIWRMAKIIILAVFITFNIYNYYTLDMDGYKQLGVIGSLREKYALGQIGEKDIFIFYDKLSLYSWRGRPIHDLDYTAYLYEATGNQKLLGADAASGNLKLMSTLKNDALDFSDKRTQARVKNAIITADSNQVPTVKNWLKLKLADLFGGKEKLQSTVKNLIGVKLEISAQTPKADSWFDSAPF